ncbi:hypothetical protein [Streptomyces sp. NPDC002962]|uniref:hypothetical protein n=1 Tax=Streptomyces sp. NPDC002962 TaxID=3364674 RepID=UPI0036B05B89
MSRTHLNLTDAVLHGAISGTGRAISTRLLEQLTSMFDPATPFGVFLLGLASAVAFALLSRGWRRFRQLNPASPLGMIAFTAVGAAVVVIPALFYLHYAAVRL